MTTAKPPTRYGAMGERTGGRLCSTELYRARGHDRGVSLWVSRTLATSTVGPFAMK
ncbi:hypothetical protein BRAS3809_1240003 [Bradyrhizobium sp. STM 3809]|nr:hypothetical protein BRAS3809_1240003 [Bradyrhizobium sp. STM 3809]